MKNIIYALCVSLILWIGVSFIDITNDNNSFNPSHSDWNFFVVITDMEGNR